MPEQQQLCVDAIQHLVGLISCQRIGEQDEDVCETLRGVYQQAAMEAAHSTMRVRSLPHETPALVMTYAAKISHIVRHKLRADAGMNCEAAKDKMVAYLLEPKGVKDPVKMIACRAAAAILAELPDAWVVDKQMAAAGGKLRDHILSSKNLKCAQDEARLAFANRTRCRQVPSLFRTFFETFAERARQSHLEEGRSWKAARQSTVNNLLRQRLPDDPVRAVAYVSAALLLAAIPAGPSPEYRWPTLSAADKLTEAKEKAYTSRSGSDVGTSCTSIFFAAGIDQSDAPPPASSMVQPLVLGASVPGFTTTPTDTPSLLTIGPAPGMAREMKGRGVDEQSLGLDTYTQDYFAPFSDHEAAASAASSILPEATWASLAKPCLTQPLATGTENHMSEQERWHKLRLEDTASRRNDVEWFPAQFSQGMPASAEPATATPNAAGTSQSTVQTAAAADISSAGLHRPCSFNGHVATTSGLGTTPLCGVRKGGPCLDVYSTRKCREATLFMATATATPAVTVVRSEGPVAGAEMEPEVTIPPLVRPPSLYGSGSCLDPWTVVDSPRSTDTDGCDDRGGDIFGITCDHDFDDVVRCRYHLAPSKKARWE